ncbi:hypothetical protein ARTSIC4J27_1125 [Pseudarthrobacter siccitolerans]|uniref:Uncharacterized protein n=1 Tax=Pseudarthrobacter siccitolerans TaxID=861266 RepID=A0A024GZX7_9MICC|nr:hypothetical protein ARTSIC4J27_1125 [Pseudarthrobacter siccitolerans]
MVLPGPDGLTPRPPLEVYCPGPCSRESLPTKLETSNV